MSAANKAPLNSPARRVQPGRQPASATAVRPKQPVGQAATPMPVYVDPAIRAAAIAAVEDLRPLLGEDWPRSAFEGLHPLPPTFINCAPWTSVRLAWLAAAPKRARPLPRFKGLRDRLRDARQTYDALFESAATVRPARMLWSTLPPP